MCFGVQSSVYQNDGRSAPVDRVDNGSLKELGAGASTGEETSDPNGIALEQAPVISTAEQASWLAVRGVPTGARSRRLLPLDASTLSRSECTGLVPTLVDCLDVKAE